MKTLKINLSLKKRMYKKKAAVQIACKLLQKLAPFRWAQLYKTIILDCQNESILISCDDCFAYKNCEISKKKQKEKKINLLFHPLIVWKLNSIQYSCWKVFGIKLIAEHIKPIKSKEINIFASVNNSRLSYVDKFKELFTVKLFYNNLHCSLKQPLKIQPYRFNLNHKYN